MTVVDDELARFIGALDPEPEPDRWAGWIAVAKIAAVCALALLVFIGPSDAGASEGGEQTFIVHCHSSPEALTWCEWLIWLETPGAREHFEWATTPRASATWTVWDSLAECESHGEWDYGPHSTWGSRLYEGGLQFAPSTWDAYRPSGYPHAAYLASREQQIVVGQRVQTAQGWRAWPDCSRRLGLR